VRSNRALYGDFSESVEIYVNGSLAGTVTGPASFNTNPGGISIAVIGDSFGNAPLNAFVDRFIYWNEALDATTIASLSPDLVVDPPDDLIGDYDDSGEVAVGDLNLVLFNWNADGGSLPSEWVNEVPPAGTPVGIDQLNGVLFNWGNTAAVAAVPEPGSVVLISLGVLICCATPRRRSC